MTDLTKLKELIYKNLDMIFSNLGIKGEENKGNLFCNCPIHEGSDNPTGFSYNVETNIWNCWTHGCQNQYNNDIFGLIRAVLSKKSGEEVSFGACLAWIKKILNVDHRDFDDGQIIEESDDNIGSIIKKFNEPKIRVEDSLGKTWPSNIPSEYFIRRGFSREVLEEFRVGDCQDKTSDMKFRSVVPIYNDDGSMLVGSIGRSYLEYIEPKFKIEKGFNKNNYLYNLHRAKPRALETSTLFLVEGQGDVWRLWESGVKNCVGLFGKEIYPEQINKINSLGIINLVILLDHDQAGREAKTKIKRYLDRLFRLFFPKMHTRKDVGQMSPQHIKEKILPHCKGLY